MHHFVRPKFRTALPIKAIVNGLTKGRNVDRVLLTSVLAKLVRVFKKPSYHFRFMNMDRLDKSSHLRELAQIVAGIR